MSEITLGLEAPRQPDVGRRASGARRSPAGYAEREAFGEYRRDPLSAFMGTRL